MKNPLKIFVIRKEERWLSVGFTLFFIIMNALLIHKHFDRFTMANHGHIAAWSLFNNRLYLSGYDPYAYMTLTSFTDYYAIDRHPLLTAFFYPLYLLNHWIIMTWNFNAAMFIMAVLVVIVSAYSAVFMFRTLKEVMGLKHSDSVWLTVLLFSFSSVMTSAMSPDHFIFSMFLLVMTVYIFGTYIKQGKVIEWYKVAALYLFTVGITLTNGVKTLLGALFVDGRKAFRCKYIALAFVLPTLLWMGGYALQYKYIHVPHANRTQAIMEKRKAKEPVFAYQDSINHFKSEQIRGRQLSELPFLSLINLDSSRKWGVVEWFFGESIQLHQDYVLGDVYLGRPLVVHYRSWFNYLVNAVVLLLFFWGIFVGRHKRIIQMLLSWFAIDFTIHIILGFGINEANINGPHWLFFIPVAIACLYRLDNKKVVAVVKNVVMVLTVYLAVYNCWLTVNYML